MEANILTIYCDTCFAARILSYGSSVRIYTYWFTLRWGKANLGSPSRVFQSQDLHKQAAQVPVAPRAIPGGQCKALNPVHLADGVLVTLQWQGVHYAFWFSA